MVVVRSLLLMAALLLVDTRPSSAPWPLGRAAEGSSSRLCVPKRSFAQPASLP